MSTFKIDIFTPYGHYLQKDINFLSIQSDDFLLGILPNHAPLITKVAISKMVIRSDTDGEEVFAIGGGILNIDEHHNAKVLVHSIENKKDIDLKRALSAKERAENRLVDKSPDIDIQRAKIALNKALVRIKVATNSDNID